MVEGAYVDPQKALMSEVHTTHPNVYIFNQYYVELLKLCKAEAKKVKDDSKPARDLLRAIKKHYASFDKLDAGHLTFFRESAGEAIAQYMASTAVVIYDAALPHEAYLDPSMIWYKGDVTFGTIATLIKMRALQHQYCLLFGLLVQEDVDGAEVVKMLQGEEVMMDSWSSENVTAMRRLMQVSAEVSKAGAGANASASPFPGLEDLESTSLGRLAKEIMEDPEVKNLQDAMRNMGTGDGTGPADIFSMLGGGGNSEASGGIAKLMGTVSQKMVQKLMSGEIKQETLLQDAMTFAGKMQGMIPGGMMGDLSKLGGMLGGLGGLGAAMGGDAGGGAGGGFDMSQLMSMMGGAMGGGGASSSQKKAGAARMAQKSRHTSAADRAKRKLAARRLDAADAAEAEAKP